MKFTVTLFWFGLCFWTAVLCAQSTVNHTVQRKETPFGIAKKYGVDLNRLFELNRWAESGIRKGDVLVLPAPVPEAGKTGLPAPALQPHERALDDTEAGGQGVDPEDHILQDGLPEVKGIPQVRPVPPTWPSDTLCVAVLLPFSAGEDSLDRQTLRLRDIALDCAAGVRLALDSGRWLGGNLNVRFLDTGRDTSGVLKCSPADVLFGERPADIVVGPLRRPVFKEVRTWPGVQGAVHLLLTDLGSPMVRNAPGGLSPFTSPQDRMAGLAEHVVSLHPGERVMMLATGDIRNLEAEDGFREGWRRANGDSVASLVEVEVSARGLGALRDSLSDVRRNILVSPGGKASRSLAGVLQTEIQLGDTMDFVLYADGSWRDFDFLDPALCERVQLTVVDGGGARPDSLAGVDTSDSVSHDLARRMALMRGGAVGKYAWLSHDLLREALGWTSGYGRNWPRRLADQEPLIRPYGIGQGLLYSFLWQSPFGQGSGLVNGQVRLLRQHDFQWVQLDAQGSPLLKVGGQGDSLLPRSE